MNTAEYLGRHMPSIRSIINRAEGRILEATGIKLCLDITEVSELEKSDVLLFEIIHKCCTAWEITYPYLVEKKRIDKKVCMRFIVCWLLNLHFKRKVSQTKMAQLVGLKDHSSFIHSVQTAQDLYDVKDPLFMLYYLPVKHLFDEIKTN